MGWEASEVSVDRRQKKPQSEGRGDRLGGAATQQDTSDEVPARPGSAGRCLLCPSLLILPFSGWLCQSF